MTPKLIAEYTELANNYLDHIPIEKKEDFEIITAALESINDSQKYEALSNSLKGRISDIKELVDNPDMYVQNQENYGEFKGIVLQRVAAKISEFNQLTPEDKERYISGQAKGKKDRASNEPLMAQREPPSPDSEAHTISEQEMLVEQQFLFQHEGMAVNEDASSVPVDVRNLLALIDVRDLLALINDIDDATLKTEQLVSLSSYIIDNINDNELNKVYLYDICTSLANINLVKAFEIANTLTGVSGDIARYQIVMELLKLKNFDKAIEAVDQLTGTIGGVDMKDIIRNNIVTELVKNNDTDKAIEIAISIHDAQFNAMARRTIDLI